MTSSHIVWMRFGWNLRPGFVRVETVQERHPDYVFNTTLIWENPQVV